MFQYFHIKNFLYYFNLFQYYLSYHILLNIILPQALLIIFTIH